MNVCPSPQVRPQSAPPVPTHARRRLLTRTSATSGWAARLALLLPDRTSQRPTHKA